MLAKLQRKEVTLFRAAEILNVTVTTLANYLSTMRQGDNPLTTSNTGNTPDRSTFRVDGTSESDREDDSDNEDDEADTLKPVSNIQSQQNKSDITLVSTSSTMSNNKINNLNGNLNLN